MSDIQPKPHEKDGFKKPVSWLVGRDLIAGLKWIALFTAFKGKLDPRDWMTPRFYPSHLRDADKVTDFWRRRDDKNWEWKVQNDKFWAGEPARFWQQHRGTDSEEFWFDYIADSGDGQLGVYNVAYLCLSDLWADASAVPSDETGQPPAAAPDTPQRRVKFEREGTHTQLLPRGQFLFVGGDTAYHIADYESLGTRFQLPFRWAFTSLRLWLRDRERLTPPAEASVSEENEGRIPLLAPDGSVRAKDSEPARPLFGVPGNHDYYDLLDGFNRQFRRPAPSARRLLGRRPQLSILGFVREQDASYVAVQLPFKWWFWGFDTEVSKLDTRQQTFFAGLLEGHVPDKLILATPEPTTVFRRQKGLEDEHALQAFRQLRLWDFDESAPPRPPFPEVTGKAGQCRLELSGDVHHYARYYGPNTKGLPDEPKRSSRHYASVVSGGGGAFHHPSETRVSGPAAVEEQVLFPPAAVSRREVAPRLFDLRNIWHGGYVWLFGAIIAGIIYFATNVPQTSKNFLEWLMLRGGEADRPREFLWLWPFQFTPDSKLPGLPAVGFDRGITFGEFVFSTALLLLSLAAVWVGVYFFSRSIRRLSTEHEDAPPQPPAAPSAGEEPEESGEDGGAEDGAVAEDHGLPTRYRDLWPVGLCVLLAIALYLWGIRFNVSRAGQLHPFGSSLLIALHLVLAAGFVSLSVQNSAWLAHRPKFVLSTKWAVLPMWGLSALAAACALFGVWKFGGFPAAYVISDIIFSLVVVAVLLSLTLIGWTVAGELQKTAGKLLLTATGLWHAVLQLAVPLLLVRLGDWRAILLALVAVAVFSFLGGRVMRRLSQAGRFAMLGLWLLYGAILLGLPFIYHERSTLSDGGNHYSSYLPQGATNWIRGLFESSADAAWMLFIVSLATAVLLGFLLSMSWLSWYFGVALGFQGHNNEVGGAARLESFKHIVRIRLTERDLTAYVIAFEEPEADGHKLQLKLVDCFRLSVSE